MEYAIEISNLYKMYNKEGAKKLALEDLSLKVPKGSFFALLGPNGAGKSTTIEIVAGLCKKTSGSVKIGGIDIDIDLNQAKRKIGVVLQEINIDTFLTVRESLDFYTGYYGVPKSQSKTEELLEIFSLKDKADVYTYGLSGGMKRRLMVAKALVHSPEVVILDEPTAGVDVELRHHLWEYMQKLNLQGTTIIITTHYLEEAEKLCDEIAIINHGKILVQEKKKKLLEQFSTKKIIFELANNEIIIPKNLSNNYTQQNNILSVGIADPAEIAKIINDVNIAGNDIRDINITSTSLEDIFIHLVSS